MAARPRRRWNEVEAAHAWWLMRDRPSRPQGGGSQRADNRLAFASVPYALSTGCARRDIPKTFAIS